MSLFSHKPLQLKASLFNVGMDMEVYKVCFLF